MSKWTIVFVLQSNFLYFNIINLPLFRAHILERPICFIVQYDHMEYVRSNS